MGEYTRGQRQTERTRAVLAAAFSELLKKKTYNEIRVSEIIGKANIGRSTFYRNFQSKADLLVFMHEERFDSLLSPFSSESAWFSDHPAPELLVFLRAFKTLRTAPISLSHLLGSDMDYLIHRINSLLSLKFETKLAQVFKEREQIISFHLLASSIAGSYCWMIVSWLGRTDKTTPDQLAQAIQKLTSAAVKEGLGLN